MLAIVRRTYRDGPAVTRFDPTPPPVPAERVKPGRRASPGSSITWIDGSLESAGYGLGIPLAGRDLIDALNVSIRSICDSARHHDLAKNEVDDVALSYRGRFLAVIRFTPSGPVVTRFDLPSPPSGGGADTATRNSPKMSLAGANRTR